MNLKVISFLFSVTIIFSGCSTKATIKYYKTKEIALNKIYEIDFNSNEPNMEYYVKNNNFVFEGKRIFVQNNNSNIKIENIVLKKDETTNFTTNVSKDFSQCIVFNDNKCVEYLSYNEYCQNKEFILSSTYNIKENNILILTKNINSIINNQECINDKDFYLNLLNYNKQYNHLNNLISTGNIISGDMGVLNTNENDKKTTLLKKNNNDNHNNQNSNNDNHNNYNYNYNMYNRVSNIMTSYMNRQTINNMNFNDIFNDLIVKNFNQFKTSITPDLIITSIEYLEDFDLKIESSDEKIHENILDRISKQIFNNINKDFEYLINKYPLSHVLKYNYSVYLLSQNDYINSEFYINESIKLNNNIKYYEMKEELEKVRFNNRKDKEER